MWGMPTPPRSVKIDQDERGGWSSDRPRRSGGAPREADVGVRGRVLQPTDRLRFTPGSLVVIVGGSKAARDRFAERVVEERSALVSLDRVRALLTGKVAAEELDERAGQLLEAAVTKRLEAAQSVVLGADDASATSREPFVKAAARLRRPRHLILVEAPGDQVADEDREALNDLRRRLDAGELGAEGFHTSLRLGGATIGELKRLVFREPPEED
jgi:predicted kinase